MDRIKHYYTAYGLTIGSEITLSYLKEIEPTQVDLTIRRGHLPPSPPWQETKLHRAGFYAQFAQEGPDRMWLNWPSLMGFMATGGNELVVDTRITDEGLLSLFTMSEAFGLLLVQKGYFLLHGGAIQLNNKGIVFVGEPGAGKSTTVAAFANRGVRIMSDDLVCIRVNEAGKPTLIPAFSQIKIWEKSVEGLQIARDGLDQVREGANKFSWHESVLFEENAVLLEQIFVLTAVNTSEEAISEVPKSRSPIELLSYFPLPDAILQGKSLKDHFEKSVAIASITPLYKLSRPANFVKLNEFVDYLITSLT
ncbi:serine kinase [Spirosoma validum]|uniref:Serine kinase n=1 Tax=Spirosoma validum TaxID=2771355 RepID=A0A927AZX3_9BACT|nr:serine kinase [Spirosoma validum]MBD2752944.1 serine kinase [Spirosoma validum]